MRTIVIGGTGHIGTYLVPRLVIAGHEVVVVTRGQRQPYQDHPAWKDVLRVVMDRNKAESDGIFGEEIKKLKPEVVFDFTCFTLESAQQLTTALRGSIEFFAHCGTIWVRGYSPVIPSSEAEKRNPISPYGVRKNEIEAYLLNQARLDGFPASVIHPGHIVGPGWVPVGPTACHDTNAIGRLLRGESVALPNLGMESLHHVHAYDVAQGFILAFNHWSASVGESFFIVSPAAMTLRGFAEQLADRFGINANLTYLPFEEWKLTIPDEFRESAAAHVMHSSNASIDKASRLLEYKPRYSSLDAVEESVKWLIEHGKIKI